MPLVSLISPGLLYSGVGFCQRSFLKKTAKVIYRALGCSGFARVDCFITPQGGIVFNEVNTIPGFTEHSRYPGMMQAAGYSFREMLDRIVALALEEEGNR